MREFTTGRVKEPVLFKIDGTEYEAIPVNMLPVDCLLKYFETVNDGKVFEAHLEFFEVVLTEESWKLFRDRMGDPKQPITISILGEVATWLMGEVYMGGGKASGEYRD